MFGEPGASFQVKSDRCMTDRPGRLKCCHLEGCPLGSKVMTHWHSECGKLFPQCLVCLQIWFLPLVLYLHSLKRKKLKNLNVRPVRVIICSSRFRAEGTLLTLQLPFSIAVHNGNRIDIFMDIPVFQRGSITQINNFITRYHLSGQHPTWVVVS